MNERIRLLAKQTQILADQFQEQWKAGPSNEEFFQQKFAELIVRECAGRVDHILREKKDGGGTMGDEIREHFGVEE